MKNNDIFEGVSIPTNYFELSQEEKKEICLGLLETIYDTIIKNTPAHFSKLELFNRVLEQTIQHHEKIEEYEVCGLLYDTKRILDEAKDNGLHK